MLTSTNGDVGSNCTGNREQSESKQPANSVVLQLLLQVQVVRLANGTLQLRVEPQR